MIDKTIDYQINIIQTDDMNRRRPQLELTINSFYSVYHVWPGPSGPICTDGNGDILCELMGCEVANINSKHINFFKKNNTSMDVLDTQGKSLFFKPNDSSGTCTVYVDPSEK
jgi:hypothetical protein